jgi:hypothetical protein
LHHPVLLEPDDVVDRAAAAIEKVVRGFAGDTSRRGVGRDVKRA